MTLVLDSVCKRLGDFELRDLSLQVEEGEYFVLLGPSGVGKTVLLEIIAGLLRPGKGKIYWQGRDVTQLPPEQREFAIVYQDYALFPHMNVRQNIAYGLRSKRIDPRESAKRAEKTAELLNLQDLLQRDVMTLSGGEQQRVALARALVIKPALLLLDEPLSAVDPQMRSYLVEEMKNIHSETHATFLQVTHSMNEALQLGNRIGVMIAGEIQQTGAPEQIFQQPTSQRVAEFLGMRNILLVDSWSDESAVVNGVQVCVVRNPQSSRHIWIRPEEIILSREPFQSSARNQFRCSVGDWEFRNELVAVQVYIDSLELTSLITYTSFKKLDLDERPDVFATFKSSSVHCF